MAKVAKRRGRYILDYYDNQGKRQRKTLKKGITLKQAKEKLREIEDQLSKGLYIPDKKIPIFSKKPKTKASNRKIDLGPTMMAALKKWKLACPPNNLGLIFPNGAGRPLNHNNVVNRYFIPALEKAEIERIRFHNLRHTYASLLIEQGENPKYIQKQLGHSKVSTTLDIYAHLFSKVNQEAACRLEKTVFNSTGHKTVTTD